MTNQKVNQITEKTIFDFNYQWRQYGEIAVDDDEYTNSLASFNDITQRLIQAKDISGLSVGEVGSGHGRICRMLSHYSPRRIFAIEPAKDAIEISKKNLVIALINIG